MDPMDQSHGAQAPHHDEDQDEVIHLCLESPTHLSASAVALLDQARADYLDSLRLREAL
ncbi:hypothetical protein GCM10010412_041040 [Nonomuraea recticatena]|uniref:Uncharacterized protein n=1 Tax=Nonomuraea recticatena TaxID=46178 RepID=A0ABN3S0E9_9ACTN